MDVAKREQSMKTFLGPFALMVAGGWSTNATAQQIGWFPS